ncbi:hypothetical protein BKA65DRAFT_516582 [Rhexocercosporidium sp. MPI-PUGE-AT-0058]|nr:hypothetical protein BKA65DRAFT_516582 [Rhexocercosporidium sp. MPI-PUGE-AT-0058]
MSEKRLKACMDSNKLGAVAPPLDPESLKPRDAIFDEIVKEAFQELKRRPCSTTHIIARKKCIRSKSELINLNLVEREFLISLSHCDAKALIPIPGINSKELPLKVAVSQRHYVEILLTLKGFKSCTAMFHPEANHIFTRLINEVFKPIIKKHKLKSYGFDLRQIGHATMIDVGRTQLDMFWRGGWVFADITSPLWPDIQSLFCSATQLNISRAEHNGYQDKLCKVLGYPIPGYPKQEKFNRVCYMDETECGEFARLTGKSEDEIQVVGFEYDDDDGDKERWTKCEF